MKKRGFTLIELLVVIAIIGILAAIVLVSLRTARTKAYNAEIQGELAQVRSAAELYFIDNSTYAGFNNSTDFAALVPPTCANNGTTPTAYSFSATTTDYAAYVQLCGGATMEYWCVDSSGYSGQVSSAPSAQACQ